MSGAPVTDGTEVCPGTLADPNPLAQWYVCWTKSRTEKRVDERLRHAGFEAYLPLIERERKWADRTKRVALPLFPGYVFARFSLTELPRLIYTPGVAGVVQMAGRPKPLRQGELESIRALVDGVNASDVELSPSDYYSVGQEITVIDGPFKGMRGILQELCGRTRVIVRLSAIRQAVGVEMDRGFVSLVASGESATSVSERSLMALSGVYV